MSSLSRRDLIRFTGMTAGLAVVGQLLPSPFRRLGVAEAAEIADYSRGTWVPSCCNMCGGQCGIRAFVQDGRVRKIEPHPTNPNNIANVSANYDAAIAAGEHSRLCCKGNSGIKSLYDPDRLRTPLRRVGPRGSGLFEPISWDDAIAETATKLKSIRTRYGARSLVWFGEDHSFTHPQQDFCDAFGSPNYSNHSSLCDTSRKSHYRGSIGDDRPLADMENADLLLVFGWNFLSALKWIHLSAIFTRAKNRSTPLEFIYVDPVFNTTASKADQWVPIKPGTDGALALALAKILIDQNKYDATWVANYTLGFGEFQKYLNGDGTYDTVPKTAAWASAITGIPAADITALGTKLGDAFVAGKRICIDSWSGPGHHTNATQGGRAIDALYLLLGAVDKLGSMIRPNRRGPGRRSSAGFGWPAKDGWRVDGRDDVTLTEPSVSNLTLVDANGVTWNAGATIPAGTKFHKKYLASHSSGIYVEQREAMATQRDFLGIPYPVKACGVIFQNLLMSMPNVERTMEALGQMEFIFCVDTHLSETALWADIVFPGSNYLERTDFNANWVTFYSLGLRQPVVPSWINGRTETQLFLDLGAAMGFGGFKTAPENTTDQAFSEAEWNAFIASSSTNNKKTWAQLKADGVWIETGANAGTKVDKYKATSTFDAATMTNTPLTVGSQTVYVVKNASTGAALGIGTPTLANGQTFEVGFATESRRAQFWWPLMYEHWRSTPTKRPAGQVVSGDPRFHPLPYFVPPVDVPDAQYPLHFLSWKEVEHTHSRTQNNAWLDELQPGARMYIHPTDAAPLGVEEGDAVWIQTAYGQIRATAHVTKRITVGCVGFFRGHGHWALGKVAKGKGSHDGWLLPGRAELHSGQAVHKEVGCRVYKVR